MKITLDQCRWICFSAAFAVGYGPDDLAHELGVHPSLVESWRMQCLTDHEASLICTATELLIKKLESAA